MSQLNASTNVPFSDHWRIQKNSFAGCIAAECPNLSRCTTSPSFRACPINSPAYAGEVLEGSNTIMTALINSVADTIAGVTNSFVANATRISVGTGTAATNPASTQLNAEIYRDLFVDRQRPATGKVVFYWFFGPQVANGALREFGVLANNPTTTLGTGTLISRFLASINKTSVDTVSGQYTIQVASV